MRQRLDVAMVTRQLVPTRSQAESWIKLGKVTVAGKVITKPGFAVAAGEEIELLASKQYVSRAGLKLASVANTLGVQFGGKVVLDVGSSTGGFTDYALQHGASKVVAVDVGTHQLHPSLREDTRIDLRERTDIRDVYLEEKPDIIVIDVSFISLREILPHIVSHLMSDQTVVVAMVKPQFEAGKAEVNKGVIKNDTLRRRILKEFEAWVKRLFVILDKADSEVAGSKGNRERFYLLKRV